MINEQENNFKKIKLMCECVKKKSIKKVFNNLLTKVSDTDSYSKENLVNLPKARNVVSLSAPHKKRCR